MILLLELGLVLIVVGSVVRFAARGARQRNAEDHDVLTQRRVEAYMTTIRRAGDNPDLVAMTDIELQDLLLSSARNMRIQTERRFWTLLAGTLVALIAAILVGTQEGTQGFGIALAVGAVVLYGLYEFLTRMIEQPLKARGLDAERLRVE